MHAAGGDLMPSKRPTAVSITVRLFISVLRAALRYAVTRQRVPQQSAEEPEFWGIAARTPGRLDAVRRPLGPLRL